MTCQSFSAQVVSVGFFLIRSRKDLLKWPWFASLVVVEGEWRMEN